jgi:hypothetical protein
VKPNESNHQLGYGDRFLQVHEVPDPCDNYSMRIRNSSFNGTCMRMNIRNICLTMKNECRHANFVQPAEGWFLWQEVVRVGQVLWVRREQVKKAFSGPIVSGSN